MNNGLDADGQQKDSGRKASNSLDPALEQTREKGLFLTAQDKEDLIAFLKTWTNNDLMSNGNYSNPL